MNRIPSPSVAELAISIGKNVATTIRALVREKETNEEWIDKLEKVSEERAVHLLTNFATTRDYTIFLVTMPYIARSVKIGEGNDHIAIQTIGTGKKKIACLYDTVDGTWNEKAGLRFTTSCLIAFTTELHQNTAAELHLKDFSIGVVAQHHAEGLYYTDGTKAAFQRYADSKEEGVRLTTEKDVTKLRCIIDVFTAQTELRHGRAVDAVVPVMKEWRDFGRTYGSGTEFMALLGRENTQPAFGGYVSIDQKTDNIVAPLLILQGAGAKISDWEGNNLFKRKLNERVNVVVGSHSSLHHSLLKHLCGKLGNNIGTQQNY